MPLPISSIRPTVVEVNLDNLIHNIRSIKRILSSSTQLCAVVKADAYGHGSTQVAAVAVENGVSWLAVACLDEAIELRKHGITAPILILGFTPSNQLPYVAEYDIAQTVYTVESAEALSTQARKRGKQANIHIKVDTGLGRIGFQVNSNMDVLLEQLKKIYELPGIHVQGVFTHFADSSNNARFTQEQFRLFIDAIDALEKAGFKVPMKHIANSAATVRFPKMHLDMVRPGIIIYGLYPDQECKAMISLKPVLGFKTVVAHIKNVPENFPIGYGSTFVTRRPGTIATLPVGYADGYSRRMFPGGYVLIRGRKAPIAGKVCMDQCMVDVTDIPEAQQGDEVLLFGEKDGASIDVDKVALVSGTVRDEVITRISRRVPRVYIKHGKEKWYHSCLLGNNMCTPG